MREQTVVGSLLVFFTLPSAAAQETPRLAPCMCANGRTDMSRDVLPRALTESRHGFRRHGGSWSPGSGLEGQGRLATTSRAVDECGLTPI